MISARISGNPDRSIEEFQEFLSRKIGLPEDASERSLRQVFVVDGDGDFEFRPGAVKQAGVAAGLVVNIKTGSLQSSETISCFYYRQRWRHGVSYMETASRSVVGSASFGIGSPCLRALSR